MTLESVSDGALGKCSHDGLLGGGGVYLGISEGWQ